MTWVRLDDQFFRNPKMRAAGKDGRSLYLAGLCYCASQLTDGHIAKRDLPLLAAEAEVKPAVARRLVEAGCWVDKGEEYEVHDFAAMNPSRAQVQADRAAAAERQRRFRNKRTNDVTSQSGNGVTSQSSDAVTDGGSSSSPSHPIPKDVLKLSSGSTTTGAPDCKEPRATHADPLTARLLDVISSAGGKPNPTEAAAVITHLRNHVDPRDIDERIGYCATLDKPPRSAKYLLVAMQQWATEHDIDIPDMDPAAR